MLPIYVVDVLLLEPYCFQFADTEKLLTTELSRFETRCVNVIFISSALSAEPVQLSAMDLSLKTAPWEASSINMMLSLGKQESN